MYACEDLDYIRERLKTLEAERERGIRGMPVPQPTPGQAGGGGDDDESLGSFYEDYILGPFGW